MLYYFDSSAAVKKYAPEKGSEWIKSIFESTENIVYLIQIGIVEIAAALSKKVRSKELTQNEYEDALKLFLMDMRNEEYIIVQLSNEIIKLAVDLTRHYSLRGYDAVHLAAGVGLNDVLFEAKLPLLTFVSADSILCKVAQRKQLSVENPNEH